jgi:hypothetical protein
LGRFLTLIGIVFAIAVAVIVSQRLSRDSLAMLIGLSCGIMAMVPTLALGIFAWRRENARRQEAAQRQTGYPASPPPVIVVTPQGLPNYNPYPSLPPSDEPASWVPNNQERVFKIVGGDD